MSRTVLKANFVFFIVALGTSLPKESYRVDKDKIL